MNKFENKIYQGDCLELMKNIPDGSVDFVLTDLPYGITDCEWDKRIPFEPMWENFKRVTKKNAAIALFSQMPFGAALIMSNRKMFRYEWIWEKPSGVGFLNAKKMPLRKHENILIFYEKLPTYNSQFQQGKPYARECKRFTRQECYSKFEDNFSVSDGRRYPQDVIKFKGVNNNFPHGKRLTVHPTQKPIELLE